jgi:hypothetical protein
MNCLDMDSIQRKNMFEKANTIDAILDSLDGIKRAEAPQFLYSRIQGRLNSPKPGIFEKLNYLISKPAIVISFVFLILCMDITVFQSSFKSIPEKSGIATEDFFVEDNFEEMLFYDVTDSEYASIY